MALRVGVIGANGFLGGELVRLLSAHPEVALCDLGAGRSAGKKLSALRPALRGPADGTLQAFDADRLASSCDLVFLALPHGESGVAAAALRERGVRVIDLGSDFRLRAAEDHVRYYGRQPTAPQHQDEAFYSLPELTGPPPALAPLIASPGCFATAMLLTLGPLQSGLGAEGVTIYGATGSSGSGVTPSAGVHHSLRLTSFTGYKTLRHQHLGEVRQFLGDRGSVPSIRFLPHSLPVARGIMLTTVLAPGSLSGRSALERLSAQYEGAALVDVVEGEVPLGAVQHSCRTLIGVVEHEDATVVYTVIDNLLKGGSGQAVQSMNLAQGWSETLGLPVLGSWP